MASRWSLGSVLWLEIHQPGEGRAAHKTRVRSPQKIRGLAFPRVADQSPKGPLGRLDVG